MGQAQEGIAYGVRYHRVLGVGRQSTVMLLPIRRENYEMLNGAKGGADEDFLPAARRGVEAVRRPAVAVPNDSTAEQPGHKGDRAVARQSGTGA